jgi:hypothetical protein
MIYLVILQLYVLDKKAHSATLGYRMSFLIEEWKYIQLFGEHHFDGGLLSGIIRGKEVYALLKHG